jgi:hypothetical protein
MRKRCEVYVGRASDAALVADFDDEKAAVECAMDMEYLFGFPAFISRFLSGLPVCRVDCLS